MNTTTAWIDDARKLTVIFNDRSLVSYPHVEPIIYWGNKEKYFQTYIGNQIDDTTIIIHFYEDLPIGESLILQWGELDIPIYAGAIVRTKWFDNNYSAVDAILGAHCKESATTFAVWAPTAISVKVKLDAQFYVLKRHNRGVWRSTISGNWHGATYEYEVNVNGKTILVSDPYAKAMLPNSEKGIVVDLSRLKQVDENNQFRPKRTSLQDAIIYELHVRDATIHPDSNVINKGKYLGMAEIGTTTKNGYSTALSYIKELGCTHVQLLPINDYARVDELNPGPDYNWGYDPLYFQVPEGSYSVVPENPFARINECKEMISAFHREGISVILDVVFNHVFIMEESPFEKLVPGYYFRYHENGILSNGTGVGNDIASERGMARAFILDTVDFWLKEYHVDGFRFDLMGAIDIETMRQIEERCKEEPVPIMLLGEGWELSTALASERKATSRNSAQLKSIRFFNDFFRDSLKGNLFHAGDTGYVNGNGRFIERLPGLVSGSAFNLFGSSFVSEVTQTVNYVECHDNHTLWDRLELTNKDSSEMDRKKMQQLATGITLLSQGVPFIHAGQEWFRSKFGEENSYISGDLINQLDWQKRAFENESVEFVKSLIALRKKYIVFRMTSREEISRRLHILDTPNSVFGFTLLGDEEDFSIYVNPTKEKQQLQLPSPGNWKVAITNDFHKSKEERTVIGEFTFITPLELVVLQKSRKSLTSKNPDSFVNIGGIRVE
ncbi:type I pullulanase [Oceanobacillus chungangensis]|uniref:Type I pullulanase n=1 Tax=Oceanobacillus chungangensis TaxID=1229152 RepID=A0A3D8PKK7_9BACI|nr:type I pullulanase [Oceanobacillus chungangensis]RDW16202.1 type I pullulanase [Oceanobacillus chungangensis]